MQYYLSPPPMNPLSRLLAGLLAVLALVGAFFFGIFVLALVVGVGLIAWLVLWIRMLWIRRKMPAADFRTGADHREDPASGARSSAGEGEVIDAEYTVVSRRDEE